MDAKADSVAAAKGRGDKQAFHVDQPTDSGQQINKKVDAEYSLPVTASRKGTWCARGFGAGSCFVMGVWPLVAT